MAKLNKVTEAAPTIASDFAEEANSYLRRLLDEAPLRDALEKLIDEGQSRVDDLDLAAKGARAKKEAQKQLKLAQKKAAETQKKASKKAVKQQEKLARKSAGLAAEGRVLAQQKSPGLKARLALVMVAAIGALTVSETLRSKVLDLLFGAEEEFQYTPPEPPADGENPAPLSAV
jgi:vacuolar-type H+-ATPase subunit I/STV1